MINDIFCEKRDNLRMDAGFIKNRLKQLGKGQKDIAKAINRDATAVSRLVNGARKIAVHEVEAISGVLEMNSDELLSILNISDSEAQKFVEREQDDLSLLSEIVFIAEEIASGLDSRPESQDMAKIIVSVYRSQLASSDKIDYVQNVITAIAALDNTKFDNRKLRKIREKFKAIMEPAGVNVSSASMND